MTQIERITTAVKQLEQLLNLLILSLTRSRDFRVQGAKNEATKTLQFIDDLERIKP